MDSKYSTYSPATLKKRFTLSPGKSPGCLELPELQMAYVAEHVHCHEEEIQPGHFYVRILADAPIRLAVSACYALERKTLRNSPRLSSLRAFRTRKTPALPGEPTPPSQGGRPGPARPANAVLLPAITPSPLPPSPIPSPHAPPVCLVRKNSGSGVAANCTPVS